MPNGISGPSSPDAWAQHCGAPTSVIEWLHYLECAHPKSIDLGLERVRTVAQRLISLPFNCPVITVGGTNGKGTTVAALEALARAQGLKVGSYTSPHIWQFNERIRINQQPVSDEDLIRAFTAVQAAKQDVSLSYFEFTTLAAFWLFQQQTLDLVVLEVGMGGRLDATNIIDADIAVITSISFDHQEYLGDTLEAIAIEKCGIMRPNKPIICGELPLASYIQDQAQKVSAQFHLIDAKEYERISPVLVPSNIACAHRAMLLLGYPLSFTELAGIIQSLQVSGRGHTSTYQGKKLVLDVAHNTASIERLITRLEREAGSQKILILGILADKQMIEALDVLCASVDHIILTTPQASRGLPASELGKQLSSHSHKLAYQDIPAAALSMAMNMAEPNDLIIVTGSFYTVSGVTLNV